MIPASYNLSLYRGDTSRWQFKLWTDAGKTQPEDLTGATAEATIRDKTTGGSYRQLLTCTVVLPNIINMVLTDTQSRNLPAKGVWDLQVTYPSGDVASKLQGSTAVTQDVTYVDASQSGKRLAVVK